MSRADTGEPVRTVGGAIAKYAVTMTVALSLTWQCAIAEAKPSAASSSGAIASAAVAEPATTTQPVMGDHPSPATAPAAAELKVSDVQVVPPVFDPSHGQEVTIQYVLSAPAAVTVAIHGPEREFIGTVVQRADRAKGAHQETWKGRDWDGRVVPDESYFVVITAVSGNQTVTYNPLAFSGGERLIAYDLRIDQQSRSFSYVLPKAARVLVRAGIPEGPLVATISNWAPRGRGIVRESWNWSDPGRRRDAATLQDCRLAVAAYALPENSIITTGNGEPGYRAYFIEHGAKRPRLPGVIRRPAESEILSAQWQFPAYAGGDPTLALEFLGPASKNAVPPPPGVLESTAGRDESAAGAPATRPATTQPSPPPSDVIVLKGDQELIRVDIPDQAERGFMLERKFEMIIYLDDKRLLEVEQGHIPFNWPWDLAGVPAGRHILTINLASFQNHVGTATRVVEVMGNAETTDEK